MGDHVDDLEPLLDIPTVQRVLGVGRSTVLMLEAKGYLERVPLPVKAIRFRRSDLVTLIRRREAATPIQGSTVKEVFMDDLEVNTLEDTRAAAMKRAREDDQLVEILNENGGDSNA